MFEDFLEEAPYPNGEENWTFPGNLDKANLLAEVKSILPAWQQARNRQKRTTFGISALTPQTAVEYIARYHSAEPLPNPKGMARISRARFAVDDIKCIRD